MEKVFEGKRSGILDKKLKINSLLSKIIINKK
jgi:hypothetical protein